MNETENMHVTVCAAIECVRVCVCSSRENAGYRTPIAGREAFDAGRYGAERHISLCQNGRGRDVHTAKRYLLRHARDDQRT